MSRILIIEDEVAIADLEKDYLELSGFEVDIENTGDRGLLRALQEDFDLIVLDLMLPGMDGFEVCRRVRDEKNVPILMVSAKKDDIDKIRGLGLGADDYMTKPFEPDELLARVYALLRRSGAKEERPEAVFGEQVLTFKSLKLLKKGRQVSVKEKTLTLTPHEYEILLLLMEEPDKVFSRESLYEKVWKGGYYGEDNTVNVHVSNLRKKIAAVDGEEEYIKTVWGIGFKMA